MIIKTGPLLSIFLFQFCFPHLLMISDSNPRQNSPHFKSRLKWYITHYFPGFYEQYFVPWVTRAQDKKTLIPFQETIQQLMATEPFPLFTRCEIETVNRCNSTCNFCPINKLDDPRPYSKMTQSLFESIISQLARLEYSGAIALFSNNEPLLDERLPELMKITRQSLPKAFHYLYSNGTLMTLDKFKEIIVHLDRLIIDNYNDELKLIKPVQAIYDYCLKNPGYESKVTIQIRKKTEFLTTRGGAAKNRSQIKSLHSSCLMPFSQFIIRPDGKISLCCNDAVGNYTLGDLNTESIEQIWRGPKFAEIRKTLSEPSPRKNLKLCAGCDTLDGDINCDTIRHTA